MKKLLFILLSVLSLTAFAQTKKVAILEVVDREDRMSYSQKMMLRSNMARAVANTAGYEAYDRSDIDAVMSEHEFQRTGLVSNDQIRQLGEMAGVSLILVTEAVLSGDNDVFVSAKILNVETAKVEIMDNMTMKIDAYAMQQGCAQLAQRLFGVTAGSSAIEKYNITRMGTNEYTYMGKYMDKREFKIFLRNNCPQAYSQYRKGQKMANIGWGLIGGGLALAAGGTVALGINASRGDESAGLLLTGLIALPAGMAVAVGAGVPLVCVGYKTRNNAHNVYNANCASSSAAPMTFNLTAGPNGIGVAMNF